MKGVHALRANDAAHPEFAEVLKLAKESGVEVRAYDCIVGPATLKADQEIPVLFSVEDVERGQSLLNGKSAERGLSPWTLCRRTP